MAHESPSPAQPPVVSSTDAPPQLPAAVAGLPALPDRLGSGDFEAMQRFMWQSLGRGAANDQPRVFISYATGHREGHDVNGCGPGVVYACKVAHSLWEHEKIDVFSGLHVRSGEEFSKVYFDGLKEHCDVLLVVVTPALFQSKVCLKEISTAMEVQDRRVVVIFVVFEAEGLPLRNGEWGDFDATACWNEFDDPQRAEGLKAMVLNGLRRFNRFPPPAIPTILQGSPQLFADLAELVRDYLDAAVRAGARPPMANPLPRGPCM